MELFIFPLIGFALNSFSPLFLSLFLLFFFFWKIRRLLARGETFFFHDYSLSWSIIERISNWTKRVRINIQFPVYPLYNCIIQLFLFPPSLSFFFFVVSLWLLTEYAATNTRLETTHILRTPLKDGSKRKNQGKVYPASYFFKATRIAENCFFNLIRRVFNSHF